MTIYRVAFERITRETATLDVEADTPEQAKDIAEDRARQHEAYWGGDVTAIEIVGCEERIGK